MLGAANALTAFGTAWDQATARDHAARRAWRKANGCQTARERLADLGWPHWGLPVSFAEVEREARRGW